MAARKSCTHMTWAEAKAKSGSAPPSKNKDAGRIKAETHGKLLAAKILAKAGPSQDEQIQNRQAAKQARKDQQRQAQLQALREAEKEKQRQEAIAKPHERALAKMKELAEGFSLSTATTVLPGMEETEVDPALVCESKQFQLDELLALQAIYADTPDILTVADDSQWEDLQTKMEAWQNDPTQETEGAVVNHPPLRIALKRSIEDPEDEDWIAHCLVEISMPPTYPVAVTPPVIKISWFLLTQKSLVVADNKPLESLGTLDDVGLLQALTLQAQDLIGMPCLYEVMDSWFSENLFHFISISPTVLLPL
jgi:RWD domain